MSRSSNRGCRCAALLLFVFHGLIAQSALATVTGTGAAIGIDARKALNGAAAAGSRQVHLGSSDDVVFSSGTVPTDSDGNPVSAWTTKRLYTCLLFTSGLLLAASKHSCPLP